MKEEKKVTKKADEVVLKNPSFSGDPLLHDMS